MANTPPIVPAPNNLENSLMNQVLGNKLDSPFDGPLATLMNLTRNINGTLGGSTALKLYSNSEMADFAAPNEKVTFGVVLVDRATGQLILNAAITVGTAKVRRYDSTGVLISSTDMAMSKRDGNLYLLFDVANDGDQYIVTLNNDNGVIIDATYYTVPPHSEILMVTDLGSLPTIEALSEKIAKGIDVRTLYGMDAVPKNWQRGRDIYVTRFGAGGHSGLDGFDDALSAADLRSMALQPFDRVWFKRDPSGWYDFATGVPGSPGLIVNQYDVKFIQEPIFAVYDAFKKDYVDYQDNAGALSNSDAGGTVVTLNSLTSTWKNLLIFGGPDGAPPPPTGNRGVYVYGGNGAHIFDNCRLNGFDVAAELRNPATFSKCTISFSNVGILSGEPNGGPTVAKSIFQFAGLGRNFRMIDCSSPGLVGNLVVNDSFFLGEFVPSTGIYYRGSGAIFTGNTWFGMLSTYIDSIASFAEDCRGNMAIPRSRQIPLSGASGSIDISPRDFGNDGGILDIKIPKPVFTNPLTDKLNVTISLDMPGLGWKEYVRRVIPDDVPFGLYHLWGVPFTHANKARMAWTTTGAPPPIAPIALVESGSP